MYALFRTWASIWHVSTAENNPSWRRCTRPGNASLHTWYITSRGSILSVCLFVSVCLSPPPSLFSLSLFLSASFSLSLSLPSYPSVDLSLSFLCTCVFVCVTRKPTQAHKVHTRRPYVNKSIALTNQRQMCWSATRQLSAGPNKVRGSCASKRRTSSQTRSDRGCATWNYFMQRQMSSSCAIRYDLAIRVMEEAVHAGDKCRSR